MRMLPIISLSSFGGFSPQILLLNHIVQLIIDLLLPSIHVHEISLGITLIDLPWPNNFVLWIIQEFCPMS